MEIGNLVKEMLSFAPYINPPFAFQAPKEKRKCVHTNTKKIKTKIIYIYFIFYFCICSDSIIGPCRRDQCPRGQGPRPH